MINSRHEPMFSFILTDGCALAPVMTAIESLKIANGLLETEMHYHWQILSETGADITSSSDIILRADGAFGSAPPSGNLFLNLGSQISDTFAQALSQRLHSSKYAYRRVGALSSESVELLAERRVLGSRQVVIHWDRDAALRERFSDLDIVNASYTIDRGLYSATSGTGSAGELFLAVITEDFGSEFSSHVADMLYIDTTRPASYVGRRSLSVRLGRSNEALLRIVRNMEQHIEEPLSLRKLASKAGVSARQAERLFQKYLEKTPLQYYLSIRLEHARRLLVHTDLTLGEVALASGFKDSSTFSKRYNQFFGIRPSLERGMLAAGKNPAHHATVTLDENSYASSVGGVRQRASSGF